MKKRTRNRIQILAVGAIFSIAILAGLYILQVNRMTALAYQISSTEKEIMELQDETRTLNSEYAKNLSFQEFETIAQNLNFQKVEVMRYITIPDTAVAANQ